VSLAMPNGSTNDRPSYRRWFIQVSHYSAWQMTRNTPTYEKAKKPTNPILQLLHASICISVTLRCSAHRNVKPLRNCIAVATIRHSPLHGLPHWQSGFLWFCFIVVSDPDGQPHRELSFALPSRRFLPGEPLWELSFIDSLLGRWSPETAHLP